MLIENNWNVKRHDVKECQVGDVYCPWYFYETENIGVPRDVGAQSIVYWIGQGSLPTLDVACTSFQIDYRGKDRAKHLQPELVEDIRTHGQHTRIDCITHCGQLALPGLIEDPALEFTHVFEGHHRLLACEHLGIDVGLRDYRVYDMLNSWSWYERYQSIYTSTLWSGWVKPHQRKPWFSYESFGKGLAETEVPVKKCFNFIVDLKIRLNRGIDVGCAEGLHTMIAARSLGVPMHGVDTEPGRILRALMVRHRDKRWDTSFHAGPWERVIQQGYDFAMLFSILHHCSDQRAAFERFALGKKVMAVEVRVAPDWADINVGSIKRIGPQGYYEGLFSKEGFEWRQVHSEPGRRWYVLWRP